MRSNALCTAMISGTVGSGNHGVSRVDTET